MVPNYYFNSISFTRCLPNCKFCNTKGNETNQECIECNSNYYPLIKSINNCYQSNTNLPNYYFNVDKFTFCNDICKYCKSLGDNLNNNCTKCKERYYLSGTNCVPCSVNCLSCDSDMCKICDSKFYLIEGKCLSCSSSEMVTDTGCVSIQSCINDVKVDVSIV
jgi:hypothetical protein